jgi:nucleotide-binding universal stress UspA family protein
VESGSLYKVIVVTDEGRSRFQRLIRGSIATEVVRKARTSVLDVR